MSIVAYIVTSITVRGQWWSAVYLHADSTVVFESHYFQTEEFAKMAAEEFCRINAHTWEHV